jgi:putative transposase
MKTVPTVRLADCSDTAGLPDLPEELRLAMTDIVGAARDGLLAMSVAAGMAVMQAMFEAAIVEVAGAEGQARCEPGCGAARQRAWLGDPGWATCPVSKPRARTIDGHEVPLTSYRYFAAADLLSQVVMERMLAELATRQHARAAEPVGDQVEATQKSAVSRRFVKQTETGLAELMARDLSGEDIKVFMLDGEHLASGASSSR